LYWIKVVSLWRVGSLNDIWVVNNFGKLVLPFIQLKVWQSIECFVSPSWTILDFMFIAFQQTGLPYLNNGIKIAVSLTTMSPLTATVTSYPWHLALNEVYGQTRDTNRIKSKTESYYFETWCKNWAWVDTIQGIDLMLELKLRPKNFWLGHVCKLKLQRWYHIFKKSYMEHSRNHL
jgi:hypothetical protein